MTNSSVRFPQFYQIPQILDRFLGSLPLVGLVLALVLPTVGVSIIVLSLMVNLFYYVLKREALDAEVT
ncbi:hypothetical protein [Lacticaseibacillus paracasei]|uniref:hypothetical protein n=1 Tax=Lacticaseibacillus paracasei TaxID=1597 RepID=UPI0013A5AC4A|nr:hypothetical protein [Lacticaseibacillus paracasei]